MNAGEALIAVAVQLGVPEALLTVWLDSYRAEVLREAAAKIRAYGLGDTDVPGAADLIDPDKAES